MHLLVSSSRVLWAQLYKPLAEMSRENSDKNQIILASAGQSVCKHSRVVRTHPPTAGKHLMAGGIYPPQVDSQFEIRYFAALCPLSSVFRLLFPCALVHFCLACPGDSSGVALAKSEVLDEAGCLYALFTSAVSAACPA